MARDFNQNRNTNAKLGIETIDKLGTTFAIQYGLDGFSAVNNVVEPMPNDIKEYLEGNDNITVFACTSNIDKLCEYALASFPNIEDLYLFKTSAIVVLEDDLSYLLDLNKIYVPSDLLSAYISAYQSLSSKFDTIVEDYTLTIPFIGDTTLTSEYVDSVIAMLSSAEKNAITKVVIPTDFSEESANEIAWNYDFSAIVNLNNNIWYGATQFDFSVLTISGSGILTSEVVESSIASISSDKLSGISKVIVPADFTGLSANCFDVIDNYLTDEDLTLELNYPYNIGYQGIGQFNKFYSISSNSKIKNLIWNNKDLGGGSNWFNIIFYLCYFTGYVLAKDSTNIGGYRGSKITRAYLPNVTNDTVTNTFEAQTYTSQMQKIFFGQPNVTRVESVTALGWTLYSNAKYLTNYINNNKFNGTKIGVVDGNGNYDKFYMNYPKLTGIDTETNIQLLTPAEDGLYLASDTGNLWQYSNGAWTDLFTDYTATWYSDEDCTITIQPSDITSDMTVYVKLA